MIFYKTKNKGEVINMNTTIYLIKHAEELEEKGIKKYRWIFTTYEWKNIFCL